jgi:AraC-like DNA-binding protein
MRRYGSGMDANHPICRKANGSGAGSVSFRRYPPPCELRGVVEAMWTFAAGPDGLGLIDCIPPDISSEIICRIGPEPCIFIRGPQLHLEEIAIPAGACYVGARLRPGVAVRLLVLPAREMCGRRLPLAPIGTAMAGATPRHALEHLARTLCTLLARQDFGARATIGTRAAALIARVHGAITAEATASAVGCTPRHLRREMNAEIGLGPKSAARIARVRRAIGLLASDRPLAEVALDAGYGDQAHMTREFARAKAPSPARMRRWRESAFANTPESAAATFSP